MGFRVVVGDVGVDDVGGDDVYYHHHQTPTITTTTAASSLSMDVRVLVVRSIRG